MTHMEGIVHYPDPQGSALKRALFRHYDIPEECLILGNGAAELFYIYFHSFRPQRTLIPVPSFSEYERAASAVNSQVEFFYLRQEDDFNISWQELGNRCEDADCLILGNPNNPTGRLLAAADVIKLIQQAEQTGTTVLIDESFLDFRHDREKYTVMSWAAAHDNVLVFQSLTKFYALPGLRLGFAAASPRIVNLMEKHKDVWNVNYLAQVAGVAALQDRQWQNRVRHFVSAERDWLYEQMMTIPGIHVYEPSVNFLFWRTLLSGETAASLTAALRAHGVLVRDCSNYTGLDGTHIRTAVRTRSENQKLLQILKEIHTKF